MSIVYKAIETEGFKANTAVLVCDSSGLKMAEIIIRPSNKKNLISARWQDQNTSTTGNHEILGELSVSPIETHTQKTAIIDSEVSKEQDTLVQQIIVRKIK
jgi:hypothetical protein